MKTLPPLVAWNVLLRSFLIQGSWNYRTMIGNGMAYALRPVLKRLDGERLGRHASHFNSHPYLSAAALGALARMEADGESAEKIGRFREAVRGPLGGIGDRLVWAGWLPLCALLGLAVFWTTGRGALAAVVFLAVYNVGHLGLRLWGFRIGWEAGPRLGSRLREAGLAKAAGRVERLLPVAIGLAVGVGLGSGAGLGADAAPAALLGAVGVVVGAAAGSRAWKPAAALTVVGVLSLLVWTAAR